MEQPLVLYIEVSLLDPELCLKYRPALRLSQSALFTSYNVATGQLCLVSSEHCPTHGKTPCTNTMGNPSLGLLPHKPVDQKSRFLFLVHKEM